MFALVSRRQPSVREKPFELGRSHEAVLQVILIVDRDVRADDHPVEECSVAMDHPPRGGEDPAGEQ